MVFINPTQLTFTKLVKFWIQPRIVLFEDLILFNVEQFFESWVVINHKLLGNLQEL
jgi:hypothetical protein